MAVLGFEMAWLLFVLSLCFVVSVLLCTHIYSLALEHGMFSYDVFCLHICVSSICMESLDCIMFRCSQFCVLVCCRYQNFICVLADKSPVARVEKRLFPCQDFRLR